MRATTDIAKRGAYLNSLKRGPHKPKEHVIYTIAPLFSSLWCSYANWAVIAPIGKYKRKDKLIIGELFYSGRTSMDFCLNGIVQYISEYNDTQCIISFTLISRNRQGELFDVKGNRIN